MGALCMIKQQWSILKKQLKDRMIEESNNNSTGNRAIPSYHIIHQNPLVPNAWVIWIKYDYTAIEIQGSIHSIKPVLLY